MNYIDPGDSADITRGKRKGHGLPNKTNEQKLPDLFEIHPPPQPNIGPAARKTDPPTSQEASVSAAKNLTDKQRRVHAMFRRFGAMHDEALIEQYRELARTPGNEMPQQTDSGIRSRRAELVALHKLRDSGRTTHTRGGGKTTIWEVVP